MERDFSSAAAHIGHDGIVKVHDAGRTSEGLLYLAMELLNGETLEDRMVQLQGQRLLLLDLIWRALAPLEREAIVLFELEGFSLEEIVALQKSSLSAVKSRLVRARGRLRRHYERHERIARAVVQEPQS